MALLEVALVPAMVPLLPVTLVSAVVLLLLATLLPVVVTILRCPSFSSAESYGTSPEEDDDVEEGVSYGNQVR
jgi:hypothetical protein